MPKQTFLNLPSEKQTIIIEISKKEFSNNLFENVSINKIIKEAGISRGSFYTYFNDKEDLYKFLIENHHEKMQKITIQVLSNSSNLKESFLKLYDEILEELEKDNTFIKNLFLNSNIKNENIMTINSNCSEKQTMIKNLINIINKDNIKSNIPLDLIIEMHFGLLVSSIIMSIKEHNKDSRDKLIKKLEILENGYKEETC